MLCRQFNLNLSSHFVVTQPQIINSLDCSNIQVWLCDLQLVKPYQHPAWSSSNITPPLLICTFSVFSQHHFFDSLLLPADRLVLWWLPSSFTWPLGSNVLHEESTSSNHVLLFSSFTQPPSSSILQEESTVWNHAPITFYLYSETPSMNSELSFDEQSSLIPSHFQMHTSRYYGCTCMLPRDMSPTQPLSQLHSIGQTHTHFNTASTLSTKLFSSYPSWLFSWPLPSSPHLSLHWRQRHLFFQFFNVLNSIDIFPFLFSCWSFTYSVRLCIDSTSNAIVGASAITFAAKTTITTAIAGSHYVSLRSELSFANSCGHSSSFSCFYFYSCIYHVYPFICCICICPSCVCSCFIITF